jgi:hypothetical protein
MFTGRQEDCEGFVKINVTKSDIGLGIVDDCERCPIARAIYRALGAGYIVSVENTVVAIRDYLREDYTVYPLPKQAIDFIQAFDTEQSVDEFSFEVNFDAG